MAPLYQRYRTRFYRPRTRYWRPRWRSRWTRRTYRRRGYRVRRRRGRMLRRKTRHVPVMQWNPINKKKCTIRGVCPLVYALGAQNAVQDFTYPGNKLILNWLGGGVHSSLLSLLDLYWEERYWRARWSSSNQGYNLFRYYGATLYLQRDYNYSYIFYYSTEELTEDTEPLTVCHPSQLLLTKHHVIVLSKKERLTSKPVKLRIKPPSSMIGTWHTFAEWAKKPILKWRISIICLSSPWTGFPSSSGTATHAIHVKVWARHTNSPHEAKEHDLWYIPLLDDGTDLSIADHKIKWNNDGTGPKQDEATFWPTAFEYRKLVVPFYLYAFGRSATYYSDTEETHMPGPTEGNQGVFLFLKFLDSPAWRGIEGGFPKFVDNCCFMKFSTVQQIAANGPWVEKSIAQGVNITMNYKFYFQWGGTPGIQLPPVAPAGGGPPGPLSAVRFGNSLRADIRDPSTIGTEVLYPEDLDSDGIINPRALARITEPHLPTGSKRTGTLACLRPAALFAKRRRPPSSEESEEEHGSSSPQESEEEAEHSTEAAERQLRRKRKRVQQLLEQLRRLGIQQPILTALSGSYQKSHSI
ncbi:putative ORF1 [Rodent Torque teno virus 3]|uniref:Capsid protein n=1 Tax=Rodent Torque teno virus 3 TaxID=2054610 RepID=A0A2H4QBA7_9VIRU|nr:putative ORF1 [Rodent Torque teno virus 3]ATX61851.1 putative ORF1 [Rodent Torque teno virus 3]